MGSRIRAVFAEVFQVDAGALAPDASPDTVQGWDSFGHLALVQALEQEFQISIAVEDIARMETLAHIEEIMVRTGARP
ncbi:MAG: acyl carrier protein [Myxococcales bacterium]